MEPSIRVPRSEFSLRAEQLLHLVREQQLGGAVLFDNYHVTYYSDFAFIPTERPVALVLAADGERILFVPRLETEHATAEAVVDRVEHYPEYPDDPHPMVRLRDVLARKGLGHPLGADSDGYPWILGYRGPSLSEVTGLSVRSIGALVEAQMMVKSPAEVSLLRESAKWSHLAHRLLQRYTRPGANETEVSLRASQEATLALLATLGPLYRARGLFAEGASAGYRGQIGRQAAIPHSLSTNAEFRAGDLLVTGATAMLWGYQAELERTLVLGAATGEQRRFFEHMVSVQQVAFCALGPGIPCSAVNRAVRAYFSAHDLMPYWKHHTGHGIGLRYHEGPFLDSGDQTLLKPGMVLTVEPGLYVAGLGGFRHSDTVVITDEGMDLLTYYPRDLDSLSLAL